MYEWLIKNFPYSEACRQQPSLLLSLRRLDVINGVTGGLVAAGLFPFTLLRTIVVLNLYILSP